MDAAAAKWVRSLESLRAVSASDPFIVAASDQAARSEDIRKVALQSLASMPDISALIKAAKKRDQAMDEGMLPAALVAVMLSPQDGTYPVRGIANGKNALIVGRSVDGTWKFFQIRIEKMKCYLSATHPIQFHNRRNLSSCEEPHHDAIFKSCKF